MKGNILVVDDMPEIVELVSEFLNASDYNVLTADNGLNALKVIEKEDVDVVLTDLRMPEMDGFELVKAIRGMNLKIGIIVMTAFTSVYTEGDIREIGVDDFLAKPFNPDMLMDKVEQVLLQTSLLKQKDK